MLLVFEHCVRVDRFKIAEFIPFLIYKFGRERAGKFVPAVTLYNYQKRADEIAAEDLEVLYKTIMLINDTASIIFVTNREISKWIKNAEDKYAMELLVKRAIENCEIVRLNKR